MSLFGDIILSIGGDASGLKNELSESYKSIKSFASDSEIKFLKYSAAGVAAGAAVAAALVKSGLDSIDAQAKLAQQMGTTSASMATLSRSGDLGGVSMQQISAASKKLSIQMGESADASSEQAKTFNRLGLSAEELSKMDLDKRIAAVNSAIKENIPATEQAAYAAELFGSKAGFAVSMLDTSAMDEARHQTELFGLALSDVDAAKVEIAGDSLSTFGAAADGAVQQMTVQLAPTLKAVGDLFMENAEKSGGMSKIVSNSFSTIIDVVGFVANAVDGLKRIFDLFFGAVGYGMSALVYTAAEAVKGLLMIADALPKIDMTNEIASVELFQDSIQRTADEHLANMKSALEEPLAGDNFKDFVKQANEAGEAAAQAAIKGREALKETSGANTKPLEQKEDPEIKQAREKSEKLAQIEADRAAKKKADDLANSQQALDNLKNSWLSESQLLDAKFTEQQEIIDKALENKQINKEMADALDQQAMQAHEDAINSINKQASDKRKASAEQEAADKKAVMQGMMDNLSSLMNSGSERMFKIGKAASLASAVIGGIESAIYAYKSGNKVGGPALGAAFMATSIATTAAKISAIKAQSFNSGGSQAAQASAARSPGSTAQTSEQQQAPSQNLYVKGINANQLFSGQQLIDTINMAQANGSVLRVG